MKPPEWNETRPILVLGCGSIGKRHLGNLWSLGVRNLCAMDPQPERREEVRQRWPIPTFSTLEEALEARPYAAFICSPPRFHVAQALELARHDVHLFLEKPLSNTLDGVDELIAELERRDLRSLVGCNFRFHPGLQETKRLLESGAIGQVLSARASFGQYLPDWHPWEDYRRGYSARRDLGGGVVLDRIHEVDYLYWLFGEVETVFGVAGHFSRLEIETEDLAEAVLRFRSGVIGSVHVDYINRSYTCQAEIVGDQGTIRWSFQEHRLDYYLAGDGVWRSLHWPRYDVNAMYVEQTKHFLRLLAGEEPSYKDVRQARAILRVALAVLQSAQTGTQVVIDD